MHARHAAARASVAAARSDPMIALAPERAMPTTRLVSSVASCAIVLGLASAGSGCAVVSVAGAAAGAAISVTGKVIEKTIDVVTPSHAPVPN